MMDNSYNTIIDTNKSQIGQVTRINITNDGIFRVFYNDISGNMRCGLSRQSNYKQVILDTSTNRSNFDVSNIPLNNFETPLYGGTFHGNEISGNIQKAQNFYTFLYRNAQGGSIESTNIGPWRYFTELTFQNFIKQGFLKARIDGEIINLKAGLELDRYKTHDIELVIDKIEVTKNNARLFESIKTGLKMGNNSLQILDLKNS